MLSRYDFNEMYPNFRNGTVPYVRRTYFFMQTCFNINNLMSWRSLSELYVVDDLGNENQE